MSIVKHNFDALDFKMGKKKIAKVYKLFIIGFFALVTSPAFSQTGVPLLNINESPSGGTDYSLTLQVVILMTVLTLLPSLLIMMTSFVRIIIVMSLLRQAIGTAQTPPNIVLVGISLFLTFFIQVLYF